LAPELVADDEPTCRYRTTILPLEQGLAPLFSGCPVQSLTSARPTITAKKVISQPNSCRRASHLDVLLPESIREFFRCKILRPLLRLLRGGVTPRRMAWSLALGIVIGINPSVGLTTLVVILLAWMLGLNQIASQIGVHAVAPFHLLLFIPFIELGVHLFHTRRLPLSRQQIEHLSHHPWRLVRDIWQWEWHALIVWGIVAAVVMPLLALYIRRALVVLMRRNRTLMRSRPALH
jgi:uncharacterized protein (DUF2062 family)